MPLRPPRLLLRTYGFKLPNHFFGAVNQSLPFSPAHWGIPNYGLYRTRMMAALCSRPGGEQAGGFGTPLRHSLLLDPHRVRQMAAPVDSQSAGKSGGFPARQVDLVQG